MNIVPQQQFADSLMTYSAFSGKDKDVSSAVMRAINDHLAGATNVPNGADVDAVTIDQAAAMPAAQNRINTVFAGQGAGSLSIVVVGEDHSNQTDAQRANAIIAASGNGTLNPSLVVFERGMNYAVNALNAPIVREANLTQPTSNPNAWQGLSRTQRSMIVAGYLALVLAGGNQQSVDRVLVFFGANHFDIVANYFDYFARHSNAAYLAKRARTFVTIRSNG